MGFYQNIEGLLARTQPPLKRMPRGFRTTLSKDSMKVVKALEATDLAASVRDAMTAWFIVVACTGLTITAVGALGTHPVSVVTWLLAMLVIARQQRVLELMVHDASHRAWDNKNIKRNNAFANLLVAYPLASTVEGYWESHRIHHGRYGGADDPCLRRFRQMGLGAVDLSTRGRIALAVLRWLPRYNIEYYKEIGSKSWAIIAKWLMWHMAILIVPFTAALAVAGMPLVEAAASSLIAWGALWLVPSVVVLPVLRSIAESEEHDYSRADNEYDSTYTNEGVMHQLLVHPYQDSYHLIHHMFPKVPQRKHRKLHAYLLKNDEYYRNSLRRRGILQMV